MENTFIVDQKSLLWLLSSMQPICSKRTTLDVTEYILFQVSARELILKATDQEISLQASSPFENSSLSEGRFLVSGKRIFDLIKELEGAITFTLDNNQLRLRADGVDLALNIRSADDFPPFPERIENLMQIPGSFLLEQLNKVAFLVPQNNANTALNGMLLKIGPAGMTMVATDGHCLAQAVSEEYTLAQEMQWLLPKRAVIEIKKIVENDAQAPVFIGTCGNQLVFSGSNFNFFTKLIAEPFPEYSQVMSTQGFIPATVVRNDILKTLKRANCLLAGQFISTQFTFQKARLAVSLKNKEVGTLEESLVLQQFDGDSIASRFYSPYLLNGLAVFPDKEITMLIKSSSAPIMFESSENGCRFTYLVMPVSAVQQ